MMINPSELYGYGAHWLADFHEQADMHHLAQSAVEPTRAAGRSLLSRLRQRLGELLRTARLTRASAERGIPPVA